MSRFLLFTTLILSLCHSVCAQSDDSPLPRLANFKQVGHSGANPTKVLFRPTSDLNDIHSWQWDFGNQDIRLIEDSTDVMTSYDESQEFTVELIAYSRSSGIDSIKRPAVLNADDYVIRDEFMHEKFTIDHWMQDVPEDCRPRFHYEGSATFLHFYQDGGCPEHGGNDCTETGGVDCTEFSGKVNGDIICLGPGGEGRPDDELQLGTSETTGYVGWVFSLDDLELPQEGRFDVLQLKAASLECSTPDNVVARVEVERQPRAYALRLVAREMTPGEIACIERVSQPYLLPFVHGEVRIEVQWRADLHLKAPGLMQAWVSTAGQGTEEPVITLENLNNEAMSYSEIHMGLLAHDDTRMYGYLAMDRIEVRRYSKIGPLL